MRYVLLKDAEPGMLLAQDILDAQGRILIGYKCELTALYIEKLREYGFDGVYISDELSEDIELKEIITPQLRSEGLACVRERNIDGCQQVAKKIVEEILSSGDLRLELSDLRSYDDYTYAHSVNVAVICCVIGIGLKLNEKDLTNLVMAALLHDFGKLSIPTEILNKPGRLTPEEYQIMKSHARLSYELISDRWDISAHTKVAVLFHHENEDGSGYPQGLGGSEQTLFTKILHVADVYDALVSKRPYKNPYSPFDACEYMMGGCGVLFDQTVVEKLLEYVPLFPKGTMVTLSDGREGIVYENFSYHNLRPIIRLLDGTMVDLLESDNLNLTILAKQEEEHSLEKEERARREMLKPV